MIGLLNRVTARFRGFRTRIVAWTTAGIAGVMGVAMQTPWGQVIQDYLPHVPPWGVALLAGGIMGILREMTSSPPGKKEE